MQKVPRYRGLRILIVPIILYYMLIFPIVGILYVSYSPNIMEKEEANHQDKNNDNLDSLDKEKENIDIVIGRDNEPNDSINNALKSKNDSIAKHHGGITINIGPGEDSRFATGERRFFNWMLFSLLLAFLFSLPFKIFFRRKRKHRKIPVKIETFCRKAILHSPLIVASIISLPFLVQNFNFIDQLFFNNPFNEEFQEEMLFRYWLIFLLSSLLTTAFVYLWQKHNTRLKYLQHIFSPEELRKPVFKSKRGKIKYRLVFSSFLTTLLPLTIVVTYLFMSLTSLSEIDLYEPTKEEYKVIFGKYTTFFKDTDLHELIKDTNPYYINIVDTLLMFVGISSGIFVTIIYLVFFVRWTNSDILSPVKELLKNMQKTTGGQLENYSLVRTNDELGELSENYNIMTSKLHEYISHIDKMNAELEQKVKDRTAEIQAQKEEIEAQRDEVESQRDEIEQQRDYVIEQKDLITDQKKAITDSIEYAGNIQKAILPPDDYLKKILKEHFIFYKPRDIVSGDFYWAHKITQGGPEKVVVVAADSTGHGVPGAFMSMLGVTFLNEIVVKGGISNPAEILDKLKENIVNSLHQTNEAGKPKDGIDLAVCSIDFNKLQLEYAGAYNPAYIVRTIHSNKESEKLEQGCNEYGFFFQRFDEKVLIEIKADKIPIGISHKKTNKYNLKKFKLKKGDTLYLFSDGYADQFGGEKRFKFLYRRFKKLLANSSSKPINEQQEKIKKEHLLWKGHEKQVDDILVMGIKL